MPIRTRSPERVKSLGDILNAYDKGMVHIRASYRADEVAGRVASMADLEMRIIDAIFATFYPKKKKASAAP